MSLSEIESTSAIDILGPHGLKSAPQANSAGGRGPRVLKSRTAPTPTLSMLQYDRHAIRDVRPDEVLRSTKPLLIWDHLV